MVTSEVCTLTEHFEFGWTRDFRRFKTVGPKSDPLNIQCASCLDRVSNGG
jgi:hypothetical protein